MKNPVSAWERYREGREYTKEKILPLFKKYDLPGANALEFCGTFIYAVDCCSCHSQHFAGFNSCKNRYCIPCNYKRTLVWIARLYPVLKQWVENGNYVSLLNFTIRDGNDLGERLKFLYDSWVAFHHDDKKIRKYFKHRFPGGVRSLEVKKGENSNEWHPHYHCLVMQGGEFVKDSEWLIPAWHKKVGYSRDEFGRPNFRKDGDYDWNGSCWIKQVKLDNLLESILETIKYILKFEDSIFEDDDTFMEVFENMRGKRQVNTWGLLRGLSKEVEDEFDSYEEKQLESFVCTVCGCEKGELRSYYFDQIVENGIPLLNIK